MANTYDLTIAYGETTRNFMLVKNGKNKLWRVSDAPLLPPSIMTTEASPSSLNPEREIQEIQADWRRGFQDLIFEDERKYYASYNCDARFKGKVMLSPKKLTALTMPTSGYRAIDDPGMEEWDDAANLTYWTKVLDGATLARSEIEHGGSYAAWLQGSSGDNAEIYQDLPFSTSDRGVEFTLKAWCKIETGILTARIGIDDGIGDPTWTDVSETSYTQKTCVRTLDASATRLRVRFYTASSASVKDMWIDDVTVEGGLNTGACTKIINFGSTIVLASGASLIKEDSGSLTHLIDFGVDITDLCVFENRLYIALGWSNAYWYTSDLSTFTESTLTKNTAKHMAVVGANFWISDAANTVTDSDDPINGGTEFAAPSYTLPNSAYDITGLVDDDTVVFVRKQDQVYYLSGSDVFPLIPELATEVNTSINYKLYKWQGKLYIPSGINSLYEYDDGVITNISLPRYAPASEEFDEAIHAICGDNEYLYVSENWSAGVDYSEIVAGHWETIEGATDWVWHPIYHAADTNPFEVIFISNVTGTKRLYVGTDTASDGIFPYVMPVGYSDPLSESGYEVYSVGYFYTPWYRSNFASEDKYWKTIDVTSICITSKTSITVYYQKKGDTGWTELGSCTTSALAGSDYPAEVTDTFSIGVSSERIRFMFCLSATQDDDYSPILYGLGGGICVKGKLQPERKKQIDATILVAPTYRTRNLAYEAVAVSTTLGYLRAIYALTSAITATGPDGTAYTVLVDREGYVEQLTYEEETEKHENYWVTLKMLEV